jgi:hypothetical protein
VAWNADSNSGARSSLDATSVAWLLYAVALLASLTLLWVALPAHAAGAGAPPAFASALADEFEEEYEGEEGEEECEEVEEGYEVCEEEPVEGAVSEAPEECLVHSARARVFASADRDRLRLVIDYRSVAPANVSVDFFLKGSKGPLSLGRVRRHFGRQGLLRIFERLTDSQIEKARAAKSFVVRLDVPQTPRYCRRFNTKRLTVRKLVHGTSVWLQAGS